MWIAKRCPKATKEEVLNRVREGQRVSDDAKAHGINDMTIRSWLERETDNGSGIKLLKAPPFKLLTAMKSFSLRLQFRRRGGNPPQISSEFATRLKGAHLEGTR